MNCNAKPSEKFVSKMDTFAPQIPREGSWPAPPQFRNLRSETFQISEGRKGCTTEVIWRSAILISQNCRMMEASRPHLLSTVPLPPRYLPSKL